MTWHLSKKLFVLSLFSIYLSATSCNTTNPNSNSFNQTASLTAQDILGNPEYRAICYGGYRELTRDEQPTIEQLKDDLRLMQAMNIKVIRTYNVHYPHASNLLKAIKILTQEDENFEMYVMLGAWINCEDAFTLTPNHAAEDVKTNEQEIKTAVRLANEYPNIVKIIAVGNEAMVKWATSYYVQPDIILKWVNHLQKLKQTGKLNQEVWITSSDNFASWGGGTEDYHTEELTQLIQAVDYISVHTYPMHDTHYNPSFWYLTEAEQNLSKLEQTDLLMQRALNYAKSQYESVVEFAHQIDSSKPVHIGETGWASVSNGFYGIDGSRACDEYKQGKYHQLIRDWTDNNQITCFYFEAFDEQWKDASNPNGSENHFGLINLNNEAKFVIWDYVDEGKFEQLSRDGQPITKSMNGNFDQLLNTISVPNSELVN